MPEMARDHLRESDGGNPAQGPAREMANPEPSPGVGNDFPDAPDRAAPERPQDQPDPDAFAARLGLTDDDPGDGRDRGGDSPTTTSETGPDDDELDPPITEQAIETGTGLSRAASDVATKVPVVVRTGSSRVLGVLASGFGSLSERLGTLADRLRSD